MKLATSAAIVALVPAASAASAQQVSNPTYSTPAQATSTPLAGQEGSTPQTPPEADAVSGGDIVVTAQKRSEKAREVPAVLLVQDAAQLFAAGVRSPTDLTTAFPGLTYSNANSVGQPAMRGITTNASGSTVENPVAVYIDGIYQPMQAMVNSYDVSNVSNIEVLKGPQGTLFGRNVVAGAILVSTRDPELNRITGHAEVTASAFGGGSSRTAFNNADTGFISVPIVHDTLAVSVAGGFYRRDDFVRNISPLGGSTGNFTRYSLQGKILWEPTPDIKLLFNARFYKEDASIGASTRNGYAGVSADLRTNAAGVRLFPDAVVASLPWQTAADQETRARLNVQSYSLRAEFNTDVGLFTSLTALQHARSRQLADNDGGYSPQCIAAKVCSQLQFQYANPQIFSQELDFASKKFGRFSFVAGAFAYSKQIDGPVGNSAVGFLYHYRGLARSFAGFVDGTLDVTDRLSLIAGVRYTFDTEYEQGTDVITLPYTDKHTESWSAVTKRFVAKYRASDTLNLYASFSQGYQAGFLGSRAFYNKTTFAPVAPAKPTNPQYLDAYEAGAKFNLHGTTLNLSTFRYNYRDIVVQLYNGVSILFSNAAAGQVTGVDFDGNVPIGRGLSLSGGVSWLPESKFTNFPNAAVTVPTPPTAFITTSPATNLTGERLLRSPKVTVSASLSYDAHLGADKLSARATVYHSDKYHTQLGPYNDAPGYTTLALTASYTPNDGPVTFTLYGRNLTNKAYLNGTVASALGFLDYWAPPRELGGSIGYKF